MNLAKHWAASLDDYVIDLSWSADGAWLAAASAAGPLSVFAASDGARRHELPGHEGGTNTLAFAPTSPSTDEQRAPADPSSVISPPSSGLGPPSSILLASGGQDGAVKLWDAGAGQHVATTSLGSAWVEHLAWRPVLRPPSSVAQPPSSVLAAAAGRTLTFLGADGSVMHTTKPAPKTITALAWQPAGGCLAAAYFGGVCLWDGDDFLVQKEFSYANAIHALAWSPDNRWLVSGNQDPSVHLWLPEQDQEFHMSGYEGKVKELSLDHTGRWLATGGGRDCCLWDCTGAGPEGREPLMFPHDARVCAVAFQHQHGLLATASTDGVLQLWSPERKQPLRATVRMPAAATKLVWSPDDRFLAVGSEQANLYVLRCEG